MTENLFRRIVLPVASEEDAEATCRQVRSRLSGDAEVLAVHVVEKAGGAPDKASVEQREERANEIFAVVDDELSSAGISVETEILYGTDVAETILDAAAEFDASAVVFTPRGGSRWLKLLTGDTATKLIESADRPVVILPDVDGVDSSEAGSDDLSEGSDDESDPPTDEEGDG